MFKIVMASLGIWGLIIGAAAGYYFGSRGHYPLNNIGFIETTEPPNDISRFFYYSDLQVPDEDTDGRGQDVLDLIAEYQQSLSEDEFNLFAMKVYDGYSHYTASAMLIYCFHTGQTAIGTYMGNMYQVNKEISDHQFDPTTEQFRFPEVEISKQTRLYINNLVHRRMDRLANRQETSPTILCESYTTFDVETLRQISFESMFPTLYEAAMKLKPDN